MAGLPRRGKERRRRRRAGKGEGEKRAGEKRGKGMGARPRDGGAAEEGEGKKKKQCGGRLSGGVCKSGDICLEWRGAPLFVVSGAYDGVIIL